MKTRQKIVTQSLIGALTITGVLVVGACGVDSEAQDQAPPNPSVVKIDGQIGDGKLYVVEIQVDGKPVPCVVYDGYKAGGVSCAFEGVRR